MKERTLRILRCLMVPCVFGSLTLSADDYSDSQEMNSSQEAVSSEEMNTSPEVASAPQDKGHFISTYERLKGKEIAPDAGVAVSGGFDLYVEADYIYWHASEGGLAYAQYNGSLPIGATAASNNVLTQGRQIAPHFKMSSGFKVGLGLDFSYDGWDIGAMYTWLRPHASSVFNPAETGAQNASLWWGNPTIIAASTSETILTISTPSEGSADWKLHFNVVDLELGRSFFVSPQLVMRPHFGFKGTWDTQRYQVYYTNERGVTLSIAGLSGVRSGDVETYSINQHQSYWGIGPRAGLNTSWMATRNFSLFGNLSLAALWGQFKTTRTDASNVMNGANMILTSYTPINIRARTHQISPVLEMELGLCYDYWFSDDDYRFRIAASWENQLWFNQNHFIGFVNKGILGDLSLQGFTLNFRFDF